MALSRDTLSRRIRDAMRGAGLSQQELATAVAMDPTALSKALAGHRGFKSVEVALIAEHLHVSTDVLLADDGADAPLRPAMAARVQPRSSPAVEQAVARAGQICDLDVLLNDLGYPERSTVTLPPPPAITDPVRQGEMLADAVRRRAGGSDEDLPHEPQDLAALIEDSLGLDICITSLPAGLDGIALSSGRLRLALVSSGVAATRQRFTIAHEVCHLATGDARDLTVDEDVFGLHSAEERRANAFAATFLMPSHAIYEATHNQEIDEDLIARLLGRFRVSLDALAFRMHNVGAVDASGRDRIRAMASARIALRPGRVDDLQARNDRRAPGRLLARAMEAFAAGDLGVRQLAMLLDTDPERLLDELSPPRYTTELHNTDDPVYAL
jgi:Zn-dependent peptidase ImmA (M78 family)